MNYNKKRMIVALHLTVSSVMLLSGFTSPGTKMNTAGDLRYAGGEIAVQIGDSVVDGTISMIKGTKQVSQSVQTAGDVWKTEAVRIEEMIRAEEERAAEEARIAEEQAAQAAALEATQLEAANVMAGEQELLAALIYCEAGNQPYEGQVAVGAVVMSFFHSAYYAYAGLPGLLTIVNAISKDAPMSFIGEVLACVIAFVITIVAIQIVGFDDPVDEAEESEEETKKITGTEMLSGEKQEQKEQTAEIKKIESPLAGTVIPLSEVHDEVFASEMMGKGCAVIPEEGKVYAPFDGKVVGLLDSHHAVGMESTDGVEILIHVGMDTVKLNGRCFTIHVEEGEQVKKGQLLLEFDIPGIKEAGYEVTTPIVVTNSDEFNDVEMKAEGQVIVGVELLELS